MQKKLNYTNEDLENDVKLLASTIKDEGFDLILGLARGGLVPAIRLSHLLNLPMYAVNYSLKDENRHEHFDSAVKHIPDFVNKKILVVEDIADSGKTLEEVFSQHLDGLDAKSAVLIFKPRTSCFRPKYVATILMSDDWVDFHWESK